MTEDQQAPPPLEAALDGDRVAARARESSLASALLDDSSKTWTSFWRGSYEDEPAMRQEFLQTLRFSRR